MLRRCWSRVWATKLVNLVCRNEPTYHIAGANLSTDALLQGGEIVPLYIANGKIIHSGIANMCVVCDGYLDGMTVPSRASTPEKIIRLNVSWR